MLYSIIKPNIDQQEISENLIENYNFDIQKF